PPARGTDWVPGGDEQRPPVAADAPWRPDAPASPTRAPNDEILRIPQANADDPAAVIPAIAEMPAIGDIDSAVENGERATLVLKARVEALALCCERLFHIDWPAP